MAVACIFHLSLRNNYLFTYNLANYRTDRFVALVKLKRVLELHEQLFSQNNLLLFFNLKNCHFIKSCKQCM